MFLLKEGASGEHYTGVPARSSCACVEASPFLATSNSEPEIAPDYVASSSRTRSR
jgi:hypothetical protein